jgi:hypothetical protein
LAFWGELEMATKDAIETALQTFEKQMGAKEFKLSLAEYVKLLQLKQELAEDEIREIRVSWVETADKSSDQ